MGRIFVVLVLVLVSGVSCRSNPFGCKDNSDCSEGHVCVANRCEQLCETTAECARGYFCVDNICQAGTGGKPAIGAVFGNSTVSCAEAEGGFCFGDGMIIQGASLLGTSFRLDNTLAGPNFTLTVGDNPADDQVTVLFPSNLQAGTYELVAYNSAGQDQTTVRILQGEPGPSLTGQQILEKVNSEATGRFAVARVPAANDLVDHLNTATKKLDKNILPTGLGGAGVYMHLTAGIGSQAAPMSISGQDLTDLEVICGEPDGCTIMVGYRYFNDTVYGYGLCPSVQWGNPCRVHIDSARNWAVSPWCLSGAVRSWGFGQDGDATANWVLSYQGSWSAAADTTPDLIKDLCVFSDGNAEAVAVDSGAGYFFWMTNETLNNEGFSHVSRTCELLILD